MRVRGRGLVLVRRNIRTRMSMRMRPSASRRTSKVAKFLDNYQARWCVDGPTVNSEDTPLDSKYVDKRQ